MPTRISMPREHQTVWTSQNNQKDTLLTLKSDGQIRVHAYDLDVQSAQELQAALHEAIALAQAAAPAARN